MDEETNKNLILTFYIVYIYICIWISSRHEQQNLCVKLERKVQNNGTGVLKSKVDLEQGSLTHPNPFQIARFNFARNPPRKSCFFFFFCGQFPEVQLTREGAWATGRNGRNFLVARNVRVANILSYRDGSLPCDTCSNNFSPNGPAGRDNGRHKLKFRPIHAKTGELRTELCDLRPGTCVSVHRGGRQFYWQFVPYDRIYRHCPPISTLLSHPTSPPPSRVLFTRICISQLTPSNLHLPQSCSPVYLNIPWHGYFAHDDWALRGTRARSRVQLRPSPL